MDLPYDKLGIPDTLRKNLDPAAPKPLRLATAKGAFPVPPEAELGVLTVLLADSDPEVRDAAIQSLKALPRPETVVNQRTHAKILEALASLRTDRALDERIVFIRNANDRTVLMIAQRADGALCEIIADNHERLLMSPELLVSLHQNPACSDAVLERAAAFLRMQRCAPSLPEERPRAGAQGSPRPAAAPNATPVAAATNALDLEAEIEAALSGQMSPMLLERQKLEMFDLDRFDGAAKDQNPLEGFRFDFKDDGDFASILLDEAGSDSAEADPEVKGKLSKLIAAMSPGKKIKLAYLGNKEVRSILIRDRNKQVALAVVKSGRLSDAEVANYAGNRNLEGEILREIGANREWLRKYPVKVALVNNPRCPPSIAVGLVNQLQFKDLSSLSRNRNVSSVISGMALKMGKNKER